MPGAQEASQREKGWEVGQSLVFGGSRGSGREAEVLAEPPPGPPVTWTA